MKLDFMVVPNIFMVPTATLADIVLPVATSNECDSITLLHRRIDVPRYNRSSWSRPENAGPMSRS